MLTSGNDDDRLLLRALRREPVLRPPIWLMRQAGRYLPEYRALREEAGGFLEMIRSPELAAEVTLQPVRRFGLDAAILFSDILMPLEALGMELVFDERGPHFPKPLRARADINALRMTPPAQALAYVGKALKRVRAALPAETSLIGFCGGPFTLACYAVEGGSVSAHAQLRRMMYRQTSDFEALMALLAEMVARHLQYQIDCGAEVVMLFDTWAGQLTTQDYRRYARPWARTALTAVQGVAPRIVYVKGGGHLLEDLVGLDVEGVALDHRTPIGESFLQYGDRVALQGNLDPASLLSTPEDVAARTRSLLGEVGGRPGHVLGLGHGVLRWTDPECVAAMVETAKSFRV